MINEERYKILFSSRFDHLKLVSIFFLQIMLFLFFLNTSWNLNTNLLSFLITNTLVIIYKLFKVIFYQRVHKEKEIKYILMFVVI
ncbi:hypothetical protein SAMN04488134_11336 [Amphibacillus marinus]|uniref:Uncharacterized protein n=1 Tax=Amphibacillus marinus TaxID=872970 RepID=A0A1H8SLY0_9BACI|nr:hypothetical protein SAMN04488134_11336 [Amphibacillus marinus]